MLAWLVSPRHKGGRPRSADGLLDPGWLRSLSLELECPRAMERDESAEPERECVRCAEPDGPRLADPARDAAVEVLVTDGSRECTLEEHREGSCCRPQRSADEDRELPQELARLPEREGTAGLTARATELTLPCACARPDAADRRCTTLSSASSWRTWRHARASSRLERLSSALSRTICPTRQDCFEAQSRCVEDGRDGAL